MVKRQKSFEELGEHEKTKISNYRHSTMVERLGKESLAMADLKKQFNMYLIAEKIQSQNVNMPFEKKMASYAFSKNLQAKQQRQRQRQEQLDNEFADHVEKLMTEQDLAKAIVHI